MKKIINDKSFWIILIISIISLVGLTIGVIFLTRENSRKFYSAGYIINSTASKSDKLYFNDETIYKENVFNEYVFKDVDNKEVSTGKNNFIHYLDNSLSFMKNGVILDLDNFNENIVPYYNITDKSIIKYNNGGYYIETAEKTLVFGNFLGRITDNKYIVVGTDVSVKLAGNDNPVNGEYFEILFVEDGIVKIENQEGSYQTISDGTIIYVSDNVRIDLGDKSLNYGNETKLNLTELTIDGNENIDIIPEDSIVDKEDGSEGNSGEGNNTDIGSGNQDNTPSGNDEPDDSGNENGETTTVIKKEVAVNLISASSNVNSITAKFQVIDTMEAIKGNLVLTIVNTDTGKTVYTKVLSNSPDEQDVFVTSLDSDSNYVMTIVDENNDISTQYFQKSFRTDSLNLKLRREMVTENSLSYSLDFGTRSDITRADISIRDEQDNEIERFTVEKENNSVVTFDNGLKNNTLYNVVVDNVVVKNVLEEKYNTRTSDITLKEKPVLGDVFVETSDDAKIFTLKMDTKAIVDVDDSIVKYTYHVFESVKDEYDNEKLELVYSFSRDNVDDEVLKIGQKIDNNKELKANADYKYKVIVQYYDNYRFNEIETGLSEDFNIIGLPKIYFVPDDIGINKISGTVVIDDEGCAVPFTNRMCNNSNNDIIIQYYDGTSMIKNNVDINEENITLDGNKILVYFEIIGLKQNTPYIFDVSADVDFDNGNGIVNNKHLGSFTIWTEGIDGLKIQNWKKNNYSFENPISVGSEMVTTVVDSDSINAIRSLTFNLYGGDATNYIDKGAVPIANYTVTGNIKEQYFDNEKKVVSFDINSSMFQYKIDGVSYNITDLNVLKELSGGSLYEKYTIEITDAYDEGNANKFAITDNIYVYNIPSILLLEDEVTTNIVVNEITNVMTDSGNYDVGYIKDLDDDIVRGYSVTADFDDKKVRDIVGTNAISKINFYVQDSSGKIIEQKAIDFNELQEKTIYFYLGDGTDYNVYDSDLRRGNIYTFSYDLSIDDDGDPNTNELIYPSDKTVSDAYVAEKQTPKIKYYIDNSTENSITYKYKVSDYDNALYSEDGKYYIYYNVNGIENYTVEYVNDGSIDAFTLSNLSNGDIYNFSYYSAVIKDYEPARFDIGNYYFDGYYNLNDTLKYSLESDDHSNYLYIIIEDNEFTNRISSYLLTLTANGINDKYQKVISNLSKCGDKQCIILNYNDLVVKNGNSNISFKGKNVKVDLIAFYDTGFIGFSQQSKLGEYLKNLNLVSEEEKSKVGFVYQTNSVSGFGKYFAVQNGRYVLDGINIKLFDYPRGILGFELNNKNFDAAAWDIKHINLIDESNNAFASYGKIVHDTTVILKETLNGYGGIYNSSTGLFPNTTPITINPKVLDKAEIIPIKENTFKFTSIIPNVTANVTERFINGATIDIELNVDEDTLKSDYCATNDSNINSDNCSSDGEYNIYVDIYTKDICPEVIQGTGLDCVPGKSYDKKVKTEITNSNNLKGFSFVGLLPDTNYTYTLSADMNKNGKKVRNLLFDKDGKIFGGKFSTLSKDEIFTNVNYSHSSSITKESYSTRKLNLNTELKNKLNYNLVYQLYDINGVPEFGDGVIILNEEIIKDNTNYVHDITGNDFVFGSNYHELVITAVTTDLNAPLELYRGKLTYNASNYGFRKLDSVANNNTYGDFFTINMTHVAGISDITSTIIVTDTDKVINDGKFYIRLQDTNEKNLLSCKHDDAECKKACEAVYNSDQVNESLANACRLIVQIDVDTDGKIMGTCINKDKYTNVESCNVRTSADSFVTDVKFKDLKADSFYSIFVQADTYGKNYENGKLVDPNGIATVRKNQYTKSKLGFSLGSVTPTYNMNNKKLSITYVDSANLTNSLVGMEYTITERGGSKITNGVIGKTLSNPDVSDVLFINSSNPRVDIDLGGKSLSKDTTYYITISYYYINSDGNIELLQFGEGKTNQIYTIEVS